MTPKVYNSWDTDGAAYHPVTQRSSHSLKRQEREMQLVNRKGLAKKVVMDMDFPLNTKVRHPLLTPFCSYTIILLVKFKVQALFRNSSSHTGNQSTTAVGNNIPAKFLAQPVCSHLGFTLVSFELYLQSLWLQDLLKLEPALP